jgi:hypothetical protein
MAWIDPRALGARRGARSSCSLGQAIDAANTGAAVKGLPRPPAALT